MQANSAILAKALNLLRGVQVVNVAAGGCEATVRRALEGASGDISLPGNVPSGFAPAPAPF